MSLLALVLILSGLVFIISTKILPHRTASKTFLGRLINWLIAPEPEKHKVDLPIREVLYWICSIYYKKVPVVKNEQVGISLHFTPFNGPPKGANIGIRLSEWSEGNELGILPITQEIKCMKVGEPTKLSPARKTSAEFLIFPKYSGKRNLRFDFSYKDSFCGYYEGAVSIKSRQYGVTLSEPTVQLLRITGVILGLTGTMLGIINLLAK